MVSRGGDDDEHQIQTHAQEQVEEPSSSLYTSSYSLSQEVGEPQNPDSIRFNFRSERGEAAASPSDFGVCRLGCRVGGPWGCSAVRQCGLFACGVRANNPQEVKDLRSGTRIAVRKDY